MSCPLLPSDILNNKNPGTSFVVDIKKLEQMLQIYMANVHKSSDKTLNGQVQVAVVYFSTRVDCVITVNGMKVQGSEKNERKKMEWMNVVSGGNVVTQSVEYELPNDSGKESITTKLSVLQRKLTELIADAKFDGVKDTKVFVERKMVLFSDFIHKSDVYHDNSSSSYLSGNSLRIKSNLSNLLKTVSSIGFTWLDSTPLCDSLTSFCNRNDSSAQFLNDYLQYKFICLEDFVRYGHLVPIDDLLVVKRTITDDSPQINHFYMDQTFALRIRNDLLDHNHFSFEDLCSLNIMLFSNTIVKIQSNRICLSHVIHVNNFVKEISQLKPIGIISPSVDVDFFDQICLQMTRRDSFMLFECDGRIFLIRPWLTSIALLYSLNSLPIKSILLHFEIISLIYSCRSTKLLNAPSFGYPLYLVNSILVENPLLSFTPLIFDSVASSPNDIKVTHPDENSVNARKKFHSFRDSLFSKSDIGIIDSSNISRSYMTTLEYSITAISLKSIFNACTNFVESCEGLSILSWIELIKNQLILLPTQKMDRKFPFDIDKTDGSLRIARITELFLQVLLRLELFACFVRTTSSTNALLASVNRSICPQTKLKLPPKVESDLNSKMFSNVEVWNFLHTLQGLCGKLLVNLSHDTSKIVEASPSKFDDKRNLLYEFSPAAFSDFLVYCVYSRYSGVIPMCVNQLFSLYELTYPPALPRNVTVSNIQEQPSPILKSVDTSSSKFSHPAGSSSLLSRQERLFAAMKSKKQDVVIPQFKHVTEVTKAKSIHKPSSKNKRIPEVLLAAPELKKPKLNITNSFVEKQSSKVLPDFKKPLERNTSNLSAFVPIPKLKKSVAEIVGSPVKVTREVLVPATPLTTPRRNRNFGKTPTRSSLRILESPILSALRDFSNKDVSISLKRKLSM